MKEKIKKLETEWWYRLVKVFFVTFIIFGTLTSIFIGYTITEFKTVQNNNDEIKKINKTLTQEQMNNILVNAPDGVNKRQLVDKLVMHGVDIEGIDNEGIRNKVKKEQKVQKKSLIEKSPVLYFIVSSLIGVFTTILTAIIVRYIFFYISIGKKKIF